MTLPSTPTSRSVNAASSAPMQWCTRLGLLIGLVLAPLSAYSDEPAIALYREIGAVVGFGLMLVGLSFERVVMPGWRLDPGSILLLLLVAASLSAPLLNGYPWARALSYGVVLLGAVLTVQVASQITAERRESLLTELCVALVVLGLLHAGVAAVQLFAPALTDNIWIATPAPDEPRAIGNLGQPNHLASFSLWSCVGAAWLMHSGWLARRLGSRGRGVAAGAVLMTLFVATIVSSASRTGAIGVALLCLWGVTDAVLARFGRARLQTAVRGALMATPVMFLVTWQLIQSVMGALGLKFFGQTRVEVQGAQSQERLNLIQDAWGVLQHHLWTGTGWGDYNFVLTLTPLAHRNAVPVQHTHNIFLQFLVELGLPLGVLAGLLLLAAVWLAARRGLRDLSGGGLCAFMMVLLIGLHSLSEFPVWYAYFLLPTSLAYGLCLARIDAVPASGPSGTADAASSQPRQVFALAGLVMVLTGPLAVIDYQRIVQIGDQASAGAAPLVDRLAAGLSSPLFNGYAHYGVATLVQPGPVSLASARIAARNISDPRLLAAWSRSLAAVGEVDRARFVAERLKEYPGPVADAFFAPCTAAETVAAPEGDKPFQCTPASRVYEPSEMK